jgi:hypothetical protein
MYMIFKGLNGAPGEIRTPDLLIRSYCACFTVPFGERDNSRRLSGIQHSRIF